MTMLHSSIPKRYSFLLIGQILFLCLILEGCTSSKIILSTTDPTTSFKQLSARFSTTLPIDNQRVKGILKLTHSRDLQLSFRVPVVGNEIMRIVLTEDSVLIIDRIHKCYVKTTPFLFAEKFDPKHASEYSLSSIEAKMRLLGTKKTAIVKASELGCPIMNDTKVTLKKISTKSFPWYITKISNKYKRMSLNEYLKIDD